MAQMNLSTEKKIMDLENRLVVAKGEGEGVGWMGCLGLTDRCKLLLLEWISNEILPCSTENYVWSLMMEHDNERKKNAYMYVLLGSCTVENWQNTVNQL